MDESRRSEASAVPDPVAPLEPRARNRRRAAVKLAIFVVLIGVGFATLRFTPLARYLEPQVLLATLERLREAWWTPLVLLGLYLVVGPLGAPVSPVLLAGGAIYGPLLGSVYNVLGTLLSAVLSFLVARALGRDFVVHFAGERLKPVERFLADRGFWTLVRTRFLPFPFVVVNYGAALAGVPLGLFAVSSAVGLAPSVTVYTYFWSALARGAAGGEMRSAFFNLFVALSLLIGLSLVPNLIRRFRRTG